MAITESELESIRELALRGLNAAEISRSTGLKEWRVREEKNRMGLRSPSGWKPGRPRSEETRRLISESMSGMTRSPETRQRMKDSWFTGSRLETMRAVGRQVSLEEWSRRRTLAWKTIVQNQTGRHMVSKVELRVAPILEAQGYEHTGAGLFYITGVDGRVRVPDFVNREERTIVEIWGTYWHRDRQLEDGKVHETPEELVEWYRQVGWTAEVVWDEGVEERFHV